MPLETQLVQVNFGSGVDQKTDAKQVSGKLLSAKNVRQDKYGAVRKRYGHTAQGSVTASGAGKLISYKNELLAIDGKNVNTWSAQKAAFVKKDQVSEATVTRRGLTNAATSSNAPDIAEGGGYQAYTWCDSNAGTFNGSGAGGKIYVTVIDAITGAEIISATRLGTTTTLRQPRIVWCSPYFFVLAGDDNTGGTTVYAFVVDPAAAVVSGAAATSANDLATFRCFDACAIGPYFAIVYEGSTHHLTYLIYDNTLTLKKTYFTTETETPYAIGIAASSDKILWVTYGITTGGHLSGGTNYGKVVAVDFGIVSSPSVVVDPTVLLTDANRSVRMSSPLPLDAHSSAACAFDYRNDTGTGGVGRAHLTSVAKVTRGVSTTPVINITAAHRTTHWAVMASRPFLQGSKVYYWAYVGGANLNSVGIAQYSAVLLDAGLTETATTYAGRPVALSATRIAQPDFAGVCSVVTGPSSVVRVLKNADGRDGLTRVTANFDDSSRWQATEIGGAIHLSGGIPSYWDGSALGEIGFTFDPQDVFPGNTTTTDGALTADGVYNYVAVFEWVDATGQVHRSAPSTPASVTLSGGNNAVALKLPSYGVTMRQTFASGYDPKVQVGIYRTIANSAGPYYWVGTVDCDPLADLVTYTDEVNDSFAQTKHQLYTGLIDGIQPIIENTSPPSLSCLISHNQRLWGIGDDGSTVWFTKLQVEGEALAFALDFTVPFDAPLTALAEQDGILYAFTKDRIYDLSGDGPPDGGSPVNLDSPRRLATDLGCIDTRSTLLMSTGIFFQSSGGIYQISRKQAVTTTGQPIEDTLATYPTVTSAIGHPNGNHIIFTVVGDDAGARIVYDYNIGTWVTDEILSGIKIISSVVHNNTIYIMTYDGHVYYENTNTHLDDGNWVTMQVECSNVALQPLQGYQRARRMSILGDRYTSHDLTIESSVDYSSTFYSSTSWIAPVIDAMGFEQLHHHLARQKCQAVRFRFTDATPSSGSVGTGRGMSLSGLLIEIGAKRGANRLAESHKA